MNPLVSHITQFHEPIPPQISHGSGGSERANARNAILAIPHPAKNIFPDIWSIAKCGASMVLVDYKTVRVEEEEERENSFKSPGYFSKKYNQFAMMIFVIKNDFINVSKS